MKKLTVLLVGILLFSLTAVSQNPKVIFDNYGSYKSSIDLLNGKISANDIKTVDDYKVITNGDEEFYFKGDFLEYYVRTTTEDILYIRDHINISRYPLISKTDKCEVYSNKYFKIKVVQVGNNVKKVYITELSCLM